MLYSMKDILVAASKGMYAVAAPNVNSEFDARAMIEAAEEVNAPIILDVAGTAHPDPYEFGRIVRDMAIKSCVPVAINLDHGGKYEKIVEAIRSGYTSVMVDRSSLPFETNVSEVKEIVKIAHAVGVSVEAELGHVGSASQYAVDRDAALTTPEDAVKYIEETGVDCLAVAIGTAHGAYAKGFKPYLDFDRLAEIKKATNNFPLVLHGSSGTDSEDLRKACSMGINKVNIANDLYRALSNAIQSADLEGNKAYDFWVIAKDALKSKIKEMIEIYGSTGKASDFDKTPKGLTKADINLSEA